MKKRVTSLLLAMIMLLGTVPATALADTKTQSTVAATDAPTKKPTTKPTAKPTTAPTKKPATKATTAPTTKPTTKPTTAPATKPATKATTAPTTKPTTKPTTAPATKPATKATTAPTTKPATKATTAPTTKPTTAPTTRPTIASLPTEPGMHASDDCIRVLKAEEGFSKKPYWDYTQYTLGYGTSCPSDMVQYYMTNGITKQEAETLLRNHLIKIERDINTKVIDKYGLELDQNQFDALVLFSFNCGTSWCYETAGTFHTAIAKGYTGNDLIRAFALWCSAGGEIKSFLLRRRLSEANMYLNGVYSQNAPDNYCYVLYDANGGTTSPRSQGYDSELTAKPYPVPSYPGYNFQGWYTAKTGGTKVTVLDASTKGKTLYAQWKDADGKTPAEKVTEKQDPVNVTVTATDVNLRQGPGTNHTRKGVAQKGDKLTITETATGTGYLWGKSEKGWIVLQYTDYETVINSQTTKPTEATKPTKPAATTKPTATTAKPTEATKPVATTKPTTAPTVAPTAAPTTPATKPETPKVTGVTNVQDWLRVRNGPGTSYSVAGYLGPKEKVEILEQKTVGAMTWGRIAKGWISLDYVTLDKPASGSAGNTSSTENTSNTKTGKVVATELLVRSGPGTTYSIVSYLTQGASVTVTETKKNGSLNWGKIPNGWICIDYVKFDKSSAPSVPSAPSAPTTATTQATQPAKPTNTVTGTINVQDWLRIRSGPGTSYAVAGYLSPKQKVTITEQKTADGMKWGKIAEGWISMDYVILDKAQTPAKPSTPSTPSAPATQKVTKTIIADCLRVRRDAGTENTIVGYLYYGSKVEILETKTGSDGGTWGRIATGWIHMSYTK